jgi:hypothetical protein
MSAKKIAHFSVHEVISILFGVVPELESERQRHQLQNYLRGMENWDTSQAVRPVVQPEETKRLIQLLGERYKIIKAVQDEVLGSTHTGAHTPPDKDQFIKLVVAVEERLSSEILLLAM